MKNLKKKLTAVVLTLVLAVVSAMPAFAAEIENFPAQNLSSSTERYTRGLQVMLLHYNTTTRSYIVNSGGADGSYGRGTYNAVLAFQKDRNLNGKDGSCGPETWRNLRATLTYNTTDGSYYYYRGRQSYENYCMKKSVSSSPTWSCYYKGTWYYVG